MDRDKPTPPYVRRPRSAPAELGAPTSPTSPTPSPSAQPPGEMGMLGLTRQTRDTAASTLDRVGKLRLEVIDRLNHQDRQVDFVAGQLSIVIDELRAERDERAAIRMSEHRAQIEARRTDQLALIDERKARAEYRRNLAFKIIAALGAAWGGVSAWLLGGS